MRKILSVIVVVFLCMTSNAQMIKSFDCVKTSEDSVVSVYSVRIRFDQQIDNDSRMNIVKAELKKRFQVHTDKILQIEALGSKKRRTYQYKIQVAKNNMQRSLKF